MTVTTEATTGHDEPQATPHPAAHAATTTRTRAVEPEPRVAAPAAGLLAANLATVAGTTALHVAGPGGLLIAGLVGGGTAVAGAWTARAPRPRRVWPWAPPSCPPCPRAPP